MTTFSQNIRNVFGWLTVSPVTADIGPEKYHCHLSRAFVENKTCVKRIIKNVGLWISQESKYNIILSEMGKIYSPKHQTLTHRRWNHHICKLYWWFFLFFCSNMYHQFLPQIVNHCIILNFWNIWEKISGKEF